MREKLTILAHGQVLSFFITISRIVSTSLEQNGVPVPFFQSACVYLLLAFFLIPWYLRSGELGKVKWWMYLLLAFVSIQANYAAVSAFRSANIAMVALLMHLSVPFTMILSYVYLKIRYCWVHYCGGAVAIIGSLTMYLTGVYSSPTASETIKGEILSCIAAFLYSCVIGASEWCVKERSASANLEYLGFIGAFGTIISVIETTAIERGDIILIPASEETILLIVLNSLIAAFYYASFTVFLRKSESCLFNISILTSNVFSMLGFYFVFDTTINDLYWVALLCIFMGIAMYSYRTPLSYSAPNIKLYKLRSLQQQHFRI